MKEFISCLMVTRNRRELALRSVKSFMDQTWKDSELIIIDDSNEELSGFLPQDDRIKYHHYTSTQLTLGELRNISIKKAKGRLIAQWDDDDWSHPERLERQILSLGIYPFGFLHRLTLLWPERGIAGYTARREWECSFIANTELVDIRYPNLARGEDSALFSTLKSSMSFVLVDDPELYVRTVHGANTWEPAHFTQFCSEKTFHLFDSPKCDLLIKCTEFKSEMISRN